MQENETNRWFCWDPASFFSQSPVFLGRQFILQKRIFIFAIKKLRVRKFICFHSADKRYYSEVKNVLSGKIVYN